MHTSHDLVSHFVLVAKNNVNIQFRLVKNTSHGSLRISMTTESSYHPKYDSRQEEPDFNGHYIVRNANRTSHRCVYTCVPNKWLPANK